MFTLYALIFRVVTASGLSSHYSPTFYTLFTILFTLYALIFRVVTASGLSL